MADCNRVLIHAVDENAMLQEVCEVLVRSGGYRQAWVGLARKDERRSVMAGGAVGYEPGYIEGRRLTWGSDGGDQGVMGKVIASAQPHIAQNIHTSPGDASRRQRAREKGYQSSATLPLMVEGSCIGGIGLYAAEPDAFHADEIELLSELAADIAFGIATLRTRRARDQAETLLRESEHQLRAMFEQAAVGITRVDLNGVLIDVNQKFCDMLGYDRAEVIGRTIKDITHPLDYGTGARHRHNMARGSMNSVVGEKRFLRKDGSTVWARRTMSMARDGAGNPQYIISVVEDITEHKALEERFRANFEQAAVGMMHTSLERRILMVNQKFCDMIGYPAAELVGRKATTIHHPDDADADQALEKRLVAGEISTFSFEKRYIRRDGSIMWGNRTVSLARDEDGAPLYFIRVIEDVTERKEAEERYRAVFDFAPVGMLRSSLDRRILQVNPKLCEILGYQADELLKMRVPELVHPEYRETDAHLYMDAMLEGRMSTYASERPFLRKDGTDIWVNRTVSLVRDAAGRPQYFIRIIEDVSERRRAEEALRESERFATATIDALATHVCVIDDAGEIIAVNKAWREFAAENGLAAEYSWEGRNYLEIAGKSTGRDARDAARVVDGLRAVLDGRREDFSLMYACHAPSRQRWFMMRAMRFPGDGPRRAVVSHEDITEQMLSSRRRMMEHSVTRVLAEAASVDDAMPLLLRTIGEAMDWCYGSHWAWNEHEGTLTRREFWTDYGADIEPRDAHPWLRVTLDRTGGLLRRAWIGNEVTWIDDLARDSSFRRSESAAELGFRSAYSFPVTVGSEAIGVMEFFGREVRHPDEMLLQITRSLGSQIGQFIHHKQTEETLRVADERFRVAFNQASVGISMTRLDLRYLQVNDKYCEIVGYSRDELASMTVRDVILPLDIPEASEFRRKLVSGAIQSYQRERQLRRKDGSSIWVNLVATLIRDARGEPLHFVTMMQDVSERKRAEQALRESEEKFRQLADNVPEAFWIIDARTWRLIYLNPAAEAMLGGSPGERSPDTRYWMRLVHPEDRMRVKAAKRRLLANQGYDEEFRVLRGNGSVRWIHDCAFPLCDAEGNVYRVAGISADITQRKEAEQKLLHLAHYDALTGLPNRTLFYDRLKQALAQAHRNRWMVAVIFLDLDRFKNVNDTLGHVVGDELLNQVSARLLDCVRSGDTVGRLGGDEFAIVLSSIAGQRDASVVGQKIMAALKEPFALGASEMFVTASVGIPLYPSDSVDQDTLIRNADTAMYRAKDLGRNSCQFYTPEMNARALEKLSLETSLRRALERKEFLLYYQPKASLVSGEVTGVESLLRWRHPELGLISPVEFMPMLEETGLILPTGEWVIRAACEQARSWRDAGIRPMPIAVNLSARQFQARDLAGTVRRILEEFGIEGSALEIEITESSLVDNTDEAVRTLDALGALGIRIAIDDFGTGYSNLNYLKRFPLDALKIDGSFVRDVITDLDDAAITRAIITMAHYLDLSVIAEGVETEQQLSFLHANGCDEIQGFFLSRPLAADDCTAMLASGRRLQHAAVNGQAEAPAVLVVDDDDNAVLLIKRELAADGYPVFTAGDAREGLKLLDLHNIKVVVSDYSMPGMSGVEFLERVKALHPDTVRIMLTSHADFDTVTKAVNKSGIYRFVSKDWGNAHLRADIRQALASTLQAESAIQLGRERRSHSS